MIYIEETRDISQETRNMLGEATLHWLNAYIDGTAEDVVIEETAFTEASPVSSLWQAADEKYDGQNMNLSSNQAKSGVKYQSMSYSQNGQNYILTYPVDDFSLEL